jgi:hypothetical protein
MMTHEEWLNNIVSSVGHVASRDFQERTWLGGRGSEISSPTEMYNELFDDYTFDLFHEVYSRDFTSEQAAAWEKFKNLIEDYGESMPDNPEPQIVLDDPAWQLVREAAAQFVAAFAQRPFAKKGDRTAGSA